jgi:hypothetical protein
LKYELFGEPSECGLRRIRYVATGEKGGWLASERNLAQDGDAWVAGNAWVYGNAHVAGDARVGGYARVYDNAWVAGNAWVYGNAHVYDNAWVAGNAWVTGDAHVAGNARVAGDALVYGNAWVAGDANVAGNEDLWWIAGLQYTVTYTKSDDSLAIGCRRQTVSEWLKLAEQPHEDIGLLEQILRAIFAERMTTT